MPTRKLVSFFERARVEPVLTAHPTEVQRKSILDRHRAIIDAAGGARAARARRRDRARRCAREVLILWKTSELRLAKPTVADEIENGLAYFRSTFIEAIPRLYAELEDGMGRAARVAPFLRVASWIGGDRDGNPHVTAEVTEHAVERQAAVAFEHYLREVHALGAELSLSSRYTTASSELHGAGGALARSRHQPRRRAVSARAGRHLRARRRDRAPAGRRTGARRRRRARRRARTPARPSWSRIWASIATALVDDGAGLVADGRLRDADARRRGVRLPPGPLDLRQHSGVHGRVVAELLARATGRRGYETLAEPERQALLLRELATPRPLRVAARQLQRRDGAGAAHAGDRGARCTPASASARSRTTSSR